jgi:SNF2 family DNA or RNA helicase
MLPEKIEQGLVVYVANNPNRFGTLTGRKRETLALFAEVNWGTQREYVDVNHLQVHNPEAIGDLDYEIKNHRYGTIQDLRRRMTYEKLRGLLTNVFYSMRTAEIDFYPHQFKPVLRFVESATNRLLIADEVGLGKTIEAGLIWTEWQAREKARRLLIVCPPSLEPKWIRELQERFQINAEKADADDLLTKYDQFRNRPGISFALVGSYTSLRPYMTEMSYIRDDEVQKPKVSNRAKLLRTLRAREDEELMPGAVPAGQKFFDMVVFDEAHWMRNTGTSTYEMGEILSWAAKAVVCLSATPVHNKSRDLYALLRLIDPDVFRDQYVFEQLRDHNLPFIQLQNLLSQSRWNVEDVKKEAKNLPDSVWKTKIDSILSDFQDTPEKRVELRHIAEKLNLMGNFINRTRKRDVIENRVIRQPKTLQVTMTPEEAALYEAVLEQVRAHVRRSGDRLTSFHLISPALQMASCLPVVADDFKNGRWGSLEPREQQAAEWSDELFPNETYEQPQVLQHHLLQYDFAKHDSKYAKLRAIIEAIEKEEELVSDSGEAVAIKKGDKIIIFAFFKQTIAYLSRQLNRDEIKAIQLTGDTTNRDERDEILRKFESDDNRVLICSEIGAEGVDLQFARVLINYDLPWNPMRVEQRIGRIDRIGQKSNKIVIINFQIMDTIDGRIYEHLYRKIGIFEHSIGALEGILGDAAQKLYEEIFRNNLSPHEVEQRAKQTADAVKAQARLQNDLENSAENLYAFQDILNQQIEDGRRLERFIKPEELESHFIDFLDKRYGQQDACEMIPDNPFPRCFLLKISFRAKSDFETFCTTQDYAWPEGIDAGLGYSRITFDPKVHEKFKHEDRKLFLINHLHPVIRWIGKENEGENERWGRLSALKLGFVMAKAEDGEQVRFLYEPGRYIYLVVRTAFRGITNREQFQYNVMNLDTGCLIRGTDAEGLINSLVNQGESLFPEKVEGLAEAIESIRDDSAAQIGKAQQSFQDDQNIKYQIRKDQADRFFGRKKAIQRQRIQTAEMTGSKGAAGFRAILHRLEQEHQEQARKLKAKIDNLEFKFSEVAGGYFEVAQSE